MHLSARTVQWPLYISSDHHVWVRGALGLCTEMGES